MNEKLDILGLKIAPLSFVEAINYVKKLGYNHTPSYVCFANVHMTIEAHQDPFFSRQVNEATLVLTDGVPLAKACKLLYNKDQERIAGMDFMPALLKSMDKGVSKVFFYGSTPEMLSALSKKVTLEFPHVEIAGAISPPFRKLSNEEQKSYIQEIKDAKPNFVFVGLGCPKQEKWMQDNYQQINAVLLGVGGAFGTVAGLHERAPLWMQHSGLEWMYRLKQEPKRLFKRYFITNSMFISLLLKRIVKKKIHGK
jgi:N-acetylglucosaminyldiphosphoundecaprenol N-acetyl-beta-D-mannosaminyltransferase